ncbi:MAG: amidohydrolase family protein, partial [Leadbetterella sp.]
MIKPLLTSFCILFATNFAFSQAIVPQNGVLDTKPIYTLLKNVKLHSSTSNEVVTTSVLLKNNKIEKIAASIDSPKGTFEVDLNGKHLYPSFIEPFSDYGMPEVKKGRPMNYYEMQVNSLKEGAFAANQSIKPEENAALLFKNNASVATELRKLGYGAVITHPKDGIIRGNAILAALSDNKESECLLKVDVSAQYSLDKGTSTQSYPYSMQGCVSVLRQHLYDAIWLAKTNQVTERNISLDQLAKNIALPSVFAGNTPLDALRWQKIAQEFSLKPIYKLGGYEYQRIADIKKLNAHVITGINFPKVIDVEDALDAENIALAEMKHWELAPTNLSELSKNKIDFSISISDLADKTNLNSNIEKALKFGISKIEILAAMTINIARALKIDNMVGDIKTGLYANFIITNGELFETKTKILENWVLGKKFTINDVNLDDINGKYSIDNPQTGYQYMTISGENEKPQIILIHSDSIKTKTNANREKNIVSLNFKKSEKDSLTQRMNLVYTNGQLLGGLVLANGDGLTFRGIKQNLPAEPSKSDSSKKNSQSLVSKVTFPFTSYGNNTLPKSEEIIIKNATVWSNSSKGNFQGDVWIKNGKIEGVGSNLSSPSAKIIDGKDKYVTNGIIDEHSHIALFSINEIESVSSEVRQEDVIDSEDIDIYRQLAGGVTTSQLLHGSANSIGGQSAIIKLKWGELPQNLIIPNSPKFIKFALGENPKRGNTPTAPIRYPSTRMGVEQVIHDAFNRAIQYKSDWKLYNDLKDKSSARIPRKDLELDALVEILDGKRHITCHSYVQSEINMLMQLGDSLGFGVNTLTHILEGYKVADKMKARNVNASTFSDWWAYKMEVKEAIPYNASIMAKVGVNTAINSDDPEMARRLNQEAAKTMLYGGLSEIEAWKMVTLNPAKMLHLDDRLGTIEKGKDADLVVWNA